MIADKLAQKVIREAGCKAAHVCLAIRNDTQSNFMYKADQDPVSIADYSSQAIITHYISKHFPEDSVLTEETVADFEAVVSVEQQHQIIHYVSQALERPVEISEIKNLLSYRSKHPNGRVWVIDPVDGTRGFFKGDQFAIAIALAVDNQPVLSALVCPLMPFNKEIVGVIAVAQKNQGALLESLSGNLNRPLKVSKQSSLQDMRFAIGNVRHRDINFVNHLFSNEQIGGTIVQISSQAKYVAVADGEADIFFRYATDTDKSEKTWDHVAGELIVREAGGTVTDLDGELLNFSTGELLNKNRGLIVSNGQLHKGMLPIIGEYNQF